MQLRTVLCTVAAALSMAPAHADEKLVTVTTVHNPRQQAMLSRLSPEERGEVAKSGIGKPVRSVYYFRGPLVRCDIDGFTTIVDTKTNTKTVISLEKRLYSTSPFAPSATAQSAHVTVKPTSSTQTILGHRVRLYNVAMQGGDEENSGTAQVWAAADLPQPAATSLTGPATSIAAAMNKIKGLPLAVTIEMQTGYGPVDIHSKVVSVSTAPLPASLFKIPAGYRPAPPGAGVGAPPAFGG